MQKDVFQNDPLEGDDESRKPKIGITITIPIRSAEEPEG